MCIRDRYERLILAFLPAALLLVPIILHLASQAAETLSSELLRSLKGKTAALLSLQTKDQLLILLWLGCHCLAVAMLALSGAAAGDATMLGIMVLGMPLFVLALHYKVPQLTWPLLVIGLLIPVTAGTLTLTGAVQLAHVGWEGPVYMGTIGLPLAILTILVIWQVTTNEAFGHSPKAPACVQSASWRWSSWLCMFAFIPLGVLVPMLTICNATLDSEVAGSGVLAFIAVFLSITLALLGANNAANVLELERRAKVAVHRMRALLREHRVLLSPLLGRRIVEKFFDDQEDFKWWFQYRLDEPSHSDHDNDFLGVGLYSNTTDGLELFQVQEIDRLFEESAEHIGPGTIRHGPLLDTPRGAESVQTDDIRPDESLFAVRALQLLEELKTGQARRTSAATQLQRVWRRRRLRSGAVQTKLRVLRLLQTTPLREELQRVHAAYANSCRVHSSVRTGETPKICLSCLKDFLEDARLYKYCAQTKYQLHAYSRRLQTLDELLLWCANGSPQGQKKMENLFRSAGITCWDDLLYTTSLIPHIGLDEASSRQLHAVLSSVMRQGDMLTFSAFFQLVNTIAQLRYASSHSPCADGAAPEQEGKTHWGTVQTVVSTGALSDHQQPLRLLFMFHIVGNRSVVRSDLPQSLSRPRESIRSRKSTLAGMVPSGFSKLLSDDPLVQGNFDWEIERLATEADRTDAQMMASTPSTTGSFDRRGGRRLHDKVQRLILEELAEIGRVSFGKHALGEELRVDWSYLANSIALLSIVCDVGMFLTIPFAEGIWFDSGSKLNDVVLVFGFEISDHSKWLGFLIASLAVAYTFPLVAFFGVKLSTRGQLGQDEFGNRSRGCSWMGLFVVILSVYSTILFFPVCKTLCNSLNCVYHDGVGTSHHVDVDSLQCWQPYHVGLVAAAMVGLVLYLPVAGFLYPRIQFADPGLDIKYLPGYMTMMHLCRLLVMGVDLLMYRNKYAMLFAGFPIVCFALWLEWSAQPCFVTWVNHVRTVLYTCVLWAYVMALGVMHFNDRLTGTCGLAVGCAVVWIIFCGCYRPCCREDVVTERATPDEHAYLLGHSVSDEAPLGNVMKADDSVAQRVHVKSY
eukprot:TRINITY_DN2409_c0_g1_i2.p1 TRINITY_DN2409_c0_g1~~TRINITY_DN2409_c0_g1_i2.p1  ORF type:complete len:1087 (+),score=166.81 TRINITY_DN2409_c0_g1_i2:117-3377(+)